MLSDDDNIRLSRLFFDLVMRCGLSGMEAISYGLTRVMGFTPMNASVEINEITGKSVTNAQVSIYAQRGLTKISDEDRIRVNTEYGVY